MDTDQHLARLDELARTLGVSRRWLRLETDAGRIPYLRAGRRRLYRIEAVQQVLAERASTSRGSPPTQSTNSTPATP
jgi:excisionase family DNA binding protein